MGKTLWDDRAHLALYQSERGHAVRLLGMDDEADYRFSAEETAADAVARVSRDWPVDLLFCGCPELYPPPREIEHCPVRTAAYISDWNLYQPQLEHNLARFDLVLSDRLGTRELRVEGAAPRFFQPVYSHRSLIHRDRGLPRDIDILFLGNLNHAIHLARGRMLETAAALSDRYRVVIDTGYPPETYAEHFGRARIVLNFAVRREMNLRCFEAVACGALLFIEEDNLEAGDWLRAGVEAVYYRADNLAGLLAHYLEHEDERARIAAAGHAKAGALAIENRLDAFFDWMAAQPAGARAFTRFDEETRALADLLFHGNSMAPAQREAAYAALPGLLARFDSPVVELAAGCMAFERAAGAGPAERGALVKQSIGHFLAVAKRAPGEAIPWLNLAAIARLAGESALERKWLENAAGAESARHGGLLLGKVTDPWYAGWRRALAGGGAPVSLLRAAALARLAEHALEAGDFAGAREHAEESIALHPFVGYACRLAGRAALGQGDAAAAVRHLEAGLEHTAFDIDHRVLLLDALDAAGRAADARDRAAESARIFQACLPLRDAAARFQARARA